jgi:hypothetical protein
MIVETFLIVVGGMIVIILLYVLTWCLNASAPRWTRAEQQARELLRAVLTPEQYCQLSGQGHIDIASPSNPQRVYRVPKSPGHVQVREEGRLTMWLCLQPSESVPDADHVVIHKLMIEADEEAYLRKANHFVPFWLQF